MGLLRRTKPEAPRAHSALGKTPLDTHNAVRRLAGLKPHTADEMNRWLESRPDWRDGAPYPR